MTGVSGIDTESIVSQMMAVERRPQDLMKTKVASMQKAQTAWQSIADKLVALKTASDGLAALGAAANLRTVTSSVPAQVAVRSIGSGANGSSSVDVLRLATSHAHARRRRVHVGLRLDRRPHAHPHQERW